MNLNKVRTVIGEVVLLTHHARILYLSFIFSLNIGVMGVLTLLLVRIFFGFALVFLLSSRLLI
jgi:hypothetical protein